jgi:hypothetical protein
MKNKSRRMALCGMMAALAVTIMLLGGVIPLATFACPMLAGLVLIPVFVECGMKTGWAAYIAMAALGLILCPDKEAALLLAFIGHYPLVRWRLDQLRSGFLRVIAKLGVFNACIGAMYAVLFFLLNMQALMAEYREMGMIMTLICLLMGNVCLLVYDRLIAMLTLLYIRKFRDKLIK